MRTERSEAAGLPLLRVVMRVQGCAGGKGMRRRLCIQLFVRFGSDGGWIEDTCVEWEKTDWREMV